MTQYIPRQPFYFQDSYLTDKDLPTLYKMACMAKHRFKDRVDSIMISAKDLPCTTPNDPLINFVQLMQRKRFGYGFVVNKSTDGPVLLGLITERDLMGNRVMYELERMSKSEPQNIDSFLRRPVSEFMTENLVDAKKDWCMLYVLRAMQEGEFRRIPVTEYKNGKPILLGAVSARTIAEYDCRMLINGDGCKICDDNADELENELSLSPHDFEQHSSVEAEPVVLTANQYAALTEYKLENKVTNVMRRFPEVPVYPPDFPLVKAVSDMCRREFGYSFICEETKLGPVCLGILTERDIMGDRILLKIARKAKSAPHEIAELLHSPISDFMTRDPALIPDDSSMKEVLDLMCNKKIRRLGVYKMAEDHKVLIGALSARTVLNDDLAALYHILPGLPEPSDWHYTDDR